MVDLLFHAFPGILWPEHEDRHVQEFIVGVPVQFCCFPVRFKDLPIFFPDKEDDIFGIFGKYPEDG